MGCVAGKMTIGALLVASLVNGSERLPDAGLVHLKGMTRLEGLNLYGTQVSDAGIAELKQALPGGQIKK